MEKRILPNEIPEGVMLEAVEGGSYMSVWFLSYCLLVGPAERFIVRTASKSMREIDNKALQEELRVCFFQEVKHAESHEVFSQRFFEKHPYIKKFYDFSSFVNYTVLDKIAPHSLKLAIASAMEQLNSEIAYYGLQEVGKLNMPPAFEEMLNWHFVEEIEHREVVFNLLKETKTGRVAYYAGILLGLFSFAFWITAGAAFILAAKPGKFFKGLFQSFRRNGILNRLVQSTVRYCRRDYHPAQETIPEAFFDQQANVSVFVKEEKTYASNQVKPAA